MRKNIAKQDLYFMRLALREGKKGLGRTSPNPAVGAVVVKRGKVVGKGFHPRAGEPHAEVFALREAGDKARGATIYVTLEPCHHFGRTPPCTQAILEAGIARVVIGCRDPNPKAQGGADFLAEKGLEVVTGVLEKECAELCRFFLKAVKKGLPWIIAKAAMSLDGRIATRSGDSKWITGEKARRFGHRLRDIVDAILVGRGTVEADDPSLTCRLPRGRDPARIVLDTNLSLSPEKKIFNLASSAPTIIACGEDAPKEREKLFKEKGVWVWRLPLEDQKISLRALLERMLKEEMLSLLVEGGATIHGSFFEAGLVDEIYFFYGPVIIGGERAKSAILGQGPEKLAEAFWLKELRVKRLGDSLLVHGFLEEISSLTS